MNVVTMFGKVYKIKVDSTKLKFSLGVKNPFAKDKSKPLEFFDCVAFGKTKEVIANNVSEKDQLCIVGRLSASEYEGKKYTNIIVNSISFVTSTQKKVENPF